MILLCLLAALSPQEIQDRLKATVAHLASDEMKGRRAGSPEGEKAARWMAAQFEKVGLKKGGSDGFLQPFKMKQDGSDAFNVVGLLEGTADEFVVLGCHHDHLGVKDGAVFNGADDNASGCAVLLEVARLCVDAKMKPRRSILFCSFDGEERLLSGSRHFVGSGLYDLSKVAAMVCLDMMGGNFFPRDTRSLYALGAENSPEIQGVLRKISVDGLDVRPMGINLIEPMGEIYARSDYGSFRLRKIPFVFFSSGQPWTYHKPEDDVERLNFAKMEKGVHYVRQVVEALASLGARPTYAKQQGLSIDDLRAVADTVRRVLEHPGDLDLTDEEIAGLKSTVAQLDDIVKDGAVGPEHAQFLQKTGVALMTLASRRPRSEK
jgi:hypothetical protein